MRQEQLSGIGQIPPKGRLTEALENRIVEALGELRDNLEKWERKERSKGCDGSASDLALRKRTIEQLIRDVRNA